MAASKSIILFNGIAGFAATSLASLGVFEVGYKLRTSSSLSSGQNDPVYVEDEPQKQTERINDLGIPDGCSETCELTAEQLKNLKFEQRSDSSIAYEGLNEKDTFELTIENSEDSTNYPWGKKYTLKKKTAEGTVTIRNLKGDDIVLGGEGEGVEIRETSGGGKLEKVPEEVNELGIPKRCNSDQVTVEAPQTCELTKAQLQRLKFEPKDDQTSISIKGQNEGNIVTLKIEDKSDDSENYPNGKKYTLTSTSGTVTIKGAKDEDIVLKGDKGVEFRETSEGNKLETVENSLGIPRRCETSTEKCQLTKDELQRLKFEAGDGSSIEVEGLDNGTVELKIETITDPINYPRGRKYILKSTNEGNVTIKGVKGGNIVLGKDQEVEIRETVKGGKLEKVLEEVNELGIPKRCKADQAIGDTTQSCELTKEQLERLKFKTRGNEAILVEGLTEGNKVTLTIEDKESDQLNYPKGKKYILKVTTENKVTIKGPKNGDIDIEVNKDVVIRETVKGGRLEKAPEEIDKLGVPTRCEGGESPCQLTKEQLLRLRFEAKVSSFAVGGLEGNDTVELKVEDVSDSTNYPHGKKYTLTSTKDGVVIRNLKEGEINLGTNNGVVIREKQEGGLLEKGPEEVDGVGVPKNCNGTCQLTKEQLRKIKFEPKEGGSTVWIDGLGVNDSVELKVEDPKDLTNYPKNKKYSFKAKNDGVIIKETKDGDIKLEKDKTFYFREKDEGGKLETVEDSLGIPKSCKAGEIQKGSDPKTCELTADQLKSLKIQNFGGKADKVEGLTNKITLTILWEEDSKKYPGNIRYSFDNTNNNGEIKITKGGRFVKMDKNKESWFKNLKGELVLVESKTKSEVKMKEVNEILEKLGLKSLELIVSDFKDNSNLTKYQQKTDSFTKVDDLKKIHFKVLNGSAESTNPNSFSHNQKITIYFDWDSTESKFPKNMKFTFENNDFDPSFEFKKNGQSVKICKKGKDVQNIFKVEKDQDKWYLVKTN